MLGRRGRAVAVTRSSLWHRLSRRWLHYAAKVYPSALRKRAASCAKTWRVHLVRAAHTASLDNPWWHRLSQQYCIATYYQHGPQSK